MAFLNWNEFFQANSPVWIKMIMFSYFLWNGYFPNFHLWAPKLNKCGMIRMKIKFFLHFTTFSLFNQTKEDICNKNRTVFNSNHKKMIDHFFIWSPLEFIFVSKTVQISVFLQNSKINMRWNGFHTIFHHYFGRY